MESSGIGSQSVGSVAIVTILLTASIGGNFGAFFHGPLLYYDARPAYVDDAGLSATGYETVNATDVELGFSPIPFVEIQARTWISVYAAGIGGDGGASSGDAQGPGDGGAAGDGTPTSDVLSNGSVVTVFSMSALQLGPISANPVVYASDPRVLDASGVLLEEAERFLPKNVTEVTNLSIENDRPVTILGQETTMTTFDGSLVLSDDSTVDVRIRLARVVRDGELVVVLGISPASVDGTGDAFATLAENVRLVEWGEKHPDSGTASVARTTDRERAATIAAT